MALKVDLTSGGNGESNFVLPQEGARPARLMSVIDIGVQVQSPYKGKVKRPCQQVILGFDLVDDLNEEGNPVRITTGFFGLNVVVDYKTKLLHEKSKLYSIVKALDPAGTKWKGDFENLINEPCLVAVKKEERNQNTYANFDGASPVPNLEGFSVKESTCEPFVFDYSNPTKESWEKLIDRLKVKVRESVGYSESAIKDIDTEFLSNQDGGGVGEDVPF